MFKKNESAADRIIRAIIGIVLLVIGIYEVGPSEVLGVILIIVGAIILITGITGFCALYSLLGISTCKNCNK
jgi:membrane-bound ClpP family serine protease